MCSWCVVPILARKKTPSKTGGFQVSTSSHHLPAPHHILLPNLSPQRTRAFFSGCTLDSGCIAERPERRGRERYCPRLLLRTILNLRISLVPSLSSSCYGCVEVSAKEGTNIKELVNMIVEAAIEPRPTQSGGKKRCVIQ